jgi:hypothetical protein
MTAPLVAVGKIVVVEETPEWLPELRRQFAGTDLRVVPWTDSWPPISTDEDSQVVVVSGLAALLRWHHAAPAPLPSASSRVIAILATDELPCEFTLRDLGVVSVLDEFCGGERLSRTCQRWL